MPLTASASSDCLVVGASERLQNYCLQNNLSKGVVDYERLQLVDNRLRLEGYQNGVGVLGPRVFKNPQTFTIIKPAFQHQQNINGGNPPKPIVLDIGTFDDPNLYRIGGFTYGMDVAYGGRYLYGDGRYVNYSLGYNFAYSPKHSLSTNTYAASLCSYNHITSLWYVDACATASQIDKDLSEDARQTISLSTTRLLSGATGEHQEIGIGYNHYLTTSYEQNQLKLGFDTIFASGKFFGIDATLGEAVSGHLATRYAVVGNATVYIAQKPITITVAYKKSAGGNWLGMMRQEQSASIEISYPLWRAVNAVLGYHQIESNVDYFDDAYPSFGLQFAGVRF